MKMGYYGKVQPPLNDLIWYTTTEKPSVPEEENPFDVTRTHPLLTLTNSPLSFTKRGDGGEFKLAAGFCFALYFALQ
jgi:hypothetical protein